MRLCQYCWHYINKHHWGRNVGSQLPRCPQKKKALHKQQVSPERTPGTPPHLSSPCPVKKTKQANKAWVAWCGLPSPLIPCSCHFPRCHSGKSNGLGPWPCGFRAPPPSLALGFCQLSLDLAFWWDYFNTVAWRQDSVLVKLVTGQSTGYRFYHPGQLSTHVTAGFLGHSWTHRHWASSLQKAMAAVSEK